MKQAIFIGNTKKSVRFVTKSLVLILKACAKAEFSDEVTIHALNALKGSSPDSVSITNCTFAVNSGRKIRGKK